MEANYQVVYYLTPTGENPVKKFLDSLQKAQKAKVFRIFQNYEVFGLTSIIPHTKKLTGTPLWEIRIKGKDSIRIIYVIRTEKSILALHGFIKKTQKTPAKELNTAQQRFNDSKMSLDK